MRNKTAFNFGIIIRGQLGLTLVELMVSIVVSLFLIAGVLQMYISNKETYRTTATLARLQESARYVNQVIGKELRMANHAGCRHFPSDGDSVGGSVSIPSGSTLHAFLSVDNINFRGYSGSGAKADTDLGKLLPTGTIIGEIDDYSDILLIRRMSQNTAYVKTDAAAGGNSIVLKKNANLKLPISPGMIYIANDCTEKVAVFQAESILPQGTSTGYTIQLSGSTDVSPGNGVESLNNVDVPVGSEVGRLEAELIYIRNIDGVRDLARSKLTYQKTSYTVNSMTIYKPVLTTQSLIRGVESIKYIYGIDSGTDGVADTFKTSSSSPAMSDSDWNNLAVVEVIYTISSDEQLPGNMAYNADSGTNAGNLWGALKNVTHAGNGDLDGKIVRRFTTLVDLRNPPKF